MENLDTAKTLANFLGVSVAKIRKDTRLTDLPRVRIGRTVRYDRSEVLTWLREKNGER
ncbi:MAG: helix-turn-helix domain-containing protein [Deltaproteobacteria bacterium]|nr:helix-turn-helix domain-containing protein [Deltaproteobacteria bacterium]